MQILTPPALAQLPSQQNKCLGKHIQQEFQQEPPPLPYRWTSGELWSFQADWFEQQEGIAPGTEAEAVPRAGMSQAGNAVQTV